MARTARWLAGWWRGGEASSFGGLCLRPLIAVPDESLGPHEFVANNRLGGILRCWRVVVKTLLVQPSDCLRHLLGVYNFQLFTLTPVGSGSRDNLLRIGTVAN